MVARRLSVGLFLLAWGAVIFSAPAGSHPHVRDVEETLSTGDDSEERLGAIAAHLKTEESQNAQCELGSEMGRIAWERRAELPHAKDETIKKVADLIVGPTREGEAMCLTSWAANVLGMIGARPRFAIPALEKALFLAEAAEARRERTALDEINWRASLADTIRAALEAIDGKQR